MNGRLSNTIISSFFLILGLLLLVSGLFYLHSLVLLIFMAFILASALDPIVNFLRRGKIPRPLGIALVYVVILTFLGFLLSVIIPPLFQQTTQLLARVSLMLGISNITIDGLATLDLTMIANSFKQYESVFQQLQGSVGAIFDFIFSTVSTAFVFVTLILLTFYILLDFRRVSSLFAWMLPGTKAEKFRKSEEMFAKISRRMGGWVRGEFILMCTIGLMSFVGLTVLGVPYALPLAIVAGFLEILPSIGPTISAVPAILIAFFLVNPVIGLATLILYILVQQFENNLIVPIIMREAVNIHPLTTIILILSGFQLLGVAGGLMAVPIYIAIRTVCQELFPDKGPFMSFAEFLPKRGKAKA